jgi:catechol 2,3-dioxygenase-like lactoylglutathione lyase family enzyme
MSAVHYLSAFAELEVTDLDASLRWYDRVLGFKRIAPVAVGGAKAVHARRAEGQDLVLIASDGAAAAAAGGPTLNFALDGDLAELVARARAEGVEAAHRPGDADEAPEALDLVDPDGYRLRVFVRQTPVAPVTASQR